jgi:hypothetical protein
VRQEKEAGLVSIFDQSGDEVRIDCGWKKIEPKILFQRGGDKLNSRLTHET